MDSEEVEEKKAEGGWNGASELAVRQEIASGRRPAASGERPR